MVAPRVFSLHLPAVLPEVTGYKTLVQLRRQGTSGAQDAIRSLSHVTHGLHRGHSAGEHWRRLRLMPLCGTPSRFLYSSRAGLSIWTSQIVLALDPSVPVLLRRALASGLYKNRE